MFGFKQLSQGFNFLKDTIDQQVNKGRRAARGVNVTKGAMKVDSRYLKDKKPKIHTPEEIAKIKKEIKRAQDGASSVNSQFKIDPDRRSLKKSVNKSVNKSSNSRSSNLISKIGKSTSSGFKRIAAGELPSFKASPRGSSLKMPKRMPPANSPNEPFVREARIIPRAVSRTLDKITPTVIRHRKDHD